MNKVISEKRVQYTLYLKRQLSKNEDRIQAEKIALDRLSKSLTGISDKFKNELEHQLEIIKVKDEQSKKIVEESQKFAAEGEFASHSAPIASPTDEKVGSYKIQAITTMLDDFENIISKNFC